MGLKELAHVSGYPVAAIQACSQFKCTHHFLIEAWQAFYLVMLQRFIEGTTDEGGSFTSFIQSVSLHLKSSDFLAKLTKLREDWGDSTYHTSFHSFLNEMEDKNNNWKFWTRFVFEDMLAFMSISSYSFQFLGAQIGWY